MLGPLEPHDTIAFAAARAPRGLVATRRLDRVGQLLVRSLVASVALAGLGLAMSGLLGVGAVSSFSAF